MTKFVNTGPGHSTTIDSIFSQFLMILRLPQNISNIKTEYVVKLKQLYSLSAQILSDV